MWEGRRSGDEFEHTQPRDLRSTDHEVSKRLENHYSAKHPRCSGADDHISVSSRLLEPCGRRHDRVRKGGLNASSGACHHNVARLDARAEAAPKPLLARSLGAHTADCRPRLKCRPHGSQRVVLVRERKTEEPHQRAPEQLLDSCAMTLEDVDGGTHRLRPETTDRFGVHTMLRGRCDVEGK